MNLHRMRLRALLIGLIALALSIIGAFFRPEQFFRSYLWVYLYLLAIPLGSLAMLMMYHLTEGSWGSLARRPLEAATRTLGIWALLFIPIAAGARKIYPWLDPAQVAASEKLQHKQIYLNLPFFTLRAAIYLTGFCLIAYFINRWREGVAKGAKPELNAKLRKLSAGGLVFYGLAASFASFDWRMSLEPEWYSTIYGMIFCVGQGLSAMSIVVLMLAWLQPLLEPSRRYSDKALRDLGNIQLAATMVWAYLSFIQYLVVWSGNLPEEVSWFNHRIHGGWQVLIILLAAFQFGVPFFLLLFRGVKERAKVLASLCAFVLIMRILEAYWYVMPAFHPEHITATWLDLTLLAGLGGLWIFLFLTQLSRAPLFASEDPDWHEAVVIELKAGQEARHA